MNSASYTYTFPRLCNIMWSCAVISLCCVMFFFNTHVHFFSFVFLIFHCSAITYHQLDYNVTVQQLTQCFILAGESLNTHTHTRTRVLVHVGCHWSICPVILFHEIIGQAWVIPVLLWLSGHKIPDGVAQAWSNCGCNLRYVSEYNVMTVQAWACTLS